MYTDCLHLKLYKCSICTFTRESEFDFEKGTCKSQVNGVHQFISIKLAKLRNKYIILLFNF